MTTKPSNFEEDYFAREEVEQKRRLAQKQAEETEARQREELRRLHFMKCPKCGLDLQTLKRGSVEIDTCFNCKGLWLDAGELEEILKESTTGQSNTLLKGMTNLLRKK